MPEPSPPGEDTLGMGHEKSLKGLPAALNFVWKNSMEAEPRDDEAEPKGPLLSQRVL